LETLENWTKALDEGFGLDVIYLDYRKAFDSVPHRRLLEKLKTFGINGKLLQWLEFSHVKNNEDCTEGNFLTDTGGIERSYAGQRIKTATLSVVCERVASLDKE